MAKPWIRVMVRMTSDGGSFEYDRTVNPSWADHLVECAHREYPGASLVFLRTEEKVKK